MSPSRTSTAGRRTTEDLQVKLCERKKRKSGSALLVVLGFLSFMVISAVAFAIYMRTERVPSSALRRNTATRHLVKAAMAHAMSRVDDAIRNDPFPGLANTNGNVFANFYHDEGNNSMDLWLGRVFMPPDPDGLLDDSGSPVQGANEPGDLNKFAWRFAPVSETVSVLNLEALGYIPPPLVNDVRFLSRSSWAAKWQNFPFDAGRFAFCAVNVSDYFDINRTRVSVRSSPLDSCVSMRGTFMWHANNNQVENVTEETFSRLGQQLVGPEAVRQTYSNPDKNAGSAAQGTTEYVSMLDYNLAFGEKSSGAAIGPLYPLFYHWIDDNRNTGNDKFFYGGTIKTADGAMQARRQPFVTDSFATNETYEIDFATLNGRSSPTPNGQATVGGQPFFDTDTSGKNMKLRDMVVKNTDKFLKRMFDRGILGTWDIPVFYDYLDHDDVPISLAMPSVECVPMVTAVELVGNGLAKLRVEANPTPVPGTEGADIKTTTTTYTLKQQSFDFGAVGARLLVAFPFRHFSGRNVDGFKVQVAMKVFVASGAVSVRPADGLSSLRPKDRAEWNLPSKAFTVDGTNPSDADALAWSLYSDKVDVSAKIPNECKTQEDAIMQIDVMRWNESGGMQDHEFFSKIEKKKINPETGMPIPGVTLPPTYRFNLRPYKDGQLVPGGELSEEQFNAFAQDQFRTYAMLWVRITDSSGNETYDLAPAIVADDNALNNRANEDVYQDFEFGANDSSACLLFSDDPARAYTYANLLAGTYTGLDGSDPNWQPKSLATVDPRYNYAPEDWFVWNESNIDGGKWLDKIQDPQYGYFNASGRDSDIFMFASNQGYLQSLGEFAFLPRLSQWNDQPSGRCSKNFVQAPGKNASATHAAGPENIMNKACVWSTYPVDRDFYDDCAFIGIGRSTDDIQTVNPYSDDEAILMAVFSDTPCDYWTTGRIVAGAENRKEKLSDDLQKIVNKMGDKSKVSGDVIKDAKDCQKFTFCKNNDDSSSKMEAQDVKSITRVFAEAFRAGGARPWEEVYDALPWFTGLDPQQDASFKSFMGVTLNNCPLYSIDRKFLYSYWRDCFANKQQLFLIFVRAESTALGGPGEGTPSQQGGRAVALVWREPMSYNDGSNPDSTYPDSLASQQQREKYSAGRRPHRMRVLFYHQFD